MSSGRQQLASRLRNLLPGARGDESRDRSDHGIRPSLCYSWMVIRQAAIAARSAGSLSRIDYSHQAAAALQLDVVVGCVVGSNDPPWMCIGCMKRCPSR